MATRLSDATRMRIAAAYPGLLDALAAGAIMADYYQAARVSADQVRVWRMEDQARELEWQAAREQSADAYADQISEISNNPGFDSGIARVKIDGLKWLASKRNPKTYSDKAQLDVNVRTVDLTRIISEANARLAGRVPRVLEHDARTQQVIGDALSGELAAHGIKGLLSDLT